MDAYRSEQGLIDRQIISAAAPEWRAMLGAADHDFYHLPCYQSLSATPEDEPLAFLASSGDDRLLIPFHRRALPSDLVHGRTMFDIISPYGYAGPIWTRAASEGFIAQALGSFAETLREEAIVSAFIRLHTLLDPAEIFEGFGSVTAHGPSVYIDLTLSDEELWRQTRRDHRHDINRLKRTGFIASWDNWDNLDAFIACYHETMTRLGASSSYFFSPAYFAQLRACLGDRLHLCIVHRDGEVACGCLLTEIEGLSQYHLSGTATAFLREHPSKLMLHEARAWLKARGNHIFHLGGGLGARRDSLHMFKRGFSPLSADFHSWRIVPDQPLYDALVARWSALSEREPVDPNLFFPQYRAPRGG